MQNFKRKEKMMNDKKKQTNLGKSVHFFDTTEEMMKSMLHDASAFTPDLEAISKNFDTRNPYDAGVLMILMVVGLAGAVATIEEEEGEFDEHVREMYYEVLAASRKIKKEGKTKFGNGSK